MNNFTTSQAGIDLIKSSEGCVLYAYPDPKSDMATALQRDGLWNATLKGAPIPAKYQALKATPWTIGYGSTKGVVQGMSITQAQAEQRLEDDLKTFEYGVDKYVTAGLLQNQFDALVCFSYNVGLPNFSTSTLLKLLNKGDYSGAAAEFPKWNISNGKVSTALVTRRAKEQVLFCN